MMGERLVFFCVFPTLHNNVLKLHRVTGSIGKRNVNEYLESIRKEAVGEHFNIPAICQERLKKTR